MTDLSAPIRIPALRYTLPQFAELEHELMWPKVWTVACTVDHVREPADSFEYRLLGRLKPFQKGLHQPGFTHVTLSAEECRIIDMHRVLTTSVTSNVGDATDWQGQASNTV